MTLNWLHAMYGIMDGLEGRGDLPLSSFEVKMLDTVIELTWRKSDWADVAITAEALNWMVNNCPCEVWEARR